MLLYTGNQLVVVFIIPSFIISHDSGNGLADTNTNMFPEVDSTWKVSHY
jgi:hypothetical protein